MERSGSEHPTISAREMGVVACLECTQVWPIGTDTCDRCGAHLESRDPKSLQRVWAWWFAGIIFYIPANLYPMLRTQTFFELQESTIVGGSIDLIHHGSYAIAIIILLASVAVPVVKFMAIAFLAISVKRTSFVPSNQRHKLYEVVEYIGRWSMIDVFVVAILSSLVQLNTIASIYPGMASLFFALSVIFTMLSAYSFDSRMIWDAERQPDQGLSNGG